MGYWLYAFSGCPDAGNYQEIAIEGEPGEVVVRARPGGLAVMDGYVLESLDDLMMVAHFKWVASGDPSTVMPALCEASGLPLAPDARRGQ
ncbi:hypothetical protein ACWDA7_34570 [Streptomyces sp. NPDC001156]